MMLFAELDSAAWATIITTASVAVTSLVLQVLRMILDYFRERDKLKRDAETSRHLHRQDNAIADLSATANELVSEVTESNRGKA